MEYQRLQEIALGDTSSADGDYENARGRRLKKLGKWAKNNKAAIIGGVAAGGLGVGAVMAAKAIKKRRDKKRATARYEAPVVRETNYPTYTEPDVDTTDKFESDSGFDDNAMLRASGVNEVMDLKSDYTYVNGSGKLKAKLKGKLTADNIAKGADLISSIARSVKKPDSGSVDVMPTEPTEGGNKKVFIIAAVVAVLATVGFFIFKSMNKTKA